MNTLFYDDALDEDVNIPSSIFLAGPTARGVLRTPWRAEALAWLDAHDFRGSVIVPEFRDGLFDEMAPRIFGSDAASRGSPIPGMRTLSVNVLRWETIGIERAAVALFWMPFRIAAEDDPASLPGFTTRAEVAREIARSPAHVVLGMPNGALSGSHIRFHAYRAGLTIATTLEETIATAYERALL